MKTLIATALVALSLAAAITPAAAFDAKSFFSQQDRDRR